MYSIIIYNTRIKYTTDWDICRWLFIVNGGTVLTCSIVVAPIHGTHKNKPGTEIG